MIYQRVTVVHVLEELLFDLMSAMLITVFLIVLFILHPQFAKLAQPDINLILILYVYL